MNTLNKTDLDRAVDVYFDAVRSRSAAAIGAVFDPTAVLVHPAGRFSGREEIEGFYAENNLTAEQFSVEELQRCYGPATVAVELVLHLDDITSRQGDFFEFDQSGRILRLAIYTGGDGGNG
ncbi:MAG: nuclear transport factor 2 family protein [Rubrobacteraceae bacterium]